MKRKKPEIVDGAEFFQDFSYIDDQKVFEDFVDELTNDKANEKACSIDNPDCEACGS